MTHEEIEARKAEIAVELDKPDADLDALKEEVRSLNEQDAELKKNAAAAEEIRKQIAEGDGTVIEERKAENMEKTPDLMEIRKSREYINAYAEYLKTGNETEVRSLLTANVGSGTIPVPVFLQEMIETAWESDEILSRVTRTFLRGNIKVPFELSADGAYIHTEGSTAPTEEALTFGLVSLVPETIKKWVSFSDEVVDMKGEEFRRYIYDEITYRITKKLADECIDDISTASSSNGSTAIGVPQVTMAPSVTTIPTAVANLSEDARNLVVIMNRLTEVEFVAAYAAGNFSVDPFAGLTRVYTSHLPAYSTATAGSGVYAIVGDLSGMRVNYPDGNGVVIKYDDLTRKKEDIVEVLGRQYAAHGITKLGRFVNIIKPAAVTT
ncbi:MAG: phage major capsid protein [Clostridia bacterium]|nr:phage major capsid protein [Clostridia bacterium]